DYATFQLRTNRHFKDTAGTFTGLTLGDADIVTQDYRTDRVALQVQGHTETTTVELDHFTVHHVHQAVNTDDTVGYRYYGAHITGFRRHIELVDALLDYFANLGWIQ